MFIKVLIFIFTYMLIGSTTVFILKRYSTIEKQRDSPPIPLVGLGWPVFLIMGLVFVCFGVPIWFAYVLAERSHIVDLHHKGYFDGTNPHKEINTLNRNRIKLYNDWKYRKLNTWQYIHQSFKLELSEDGERLL